MTKKELKSMIREVAREEVYQVLPELLKEAVTETLTEIMSGQPKQRRRPNPQKTKNGAPNMRTMLEQIGYNEYGLQEDHNNDETYYFDSGDRAAIAQHAGSPGSYVYRTEKA